MCIEQIKAKKLTKPGDTLHGTFARIKDHASKHSDAQLEVVQMTLTGNNTSGLTFYAHAYEAAFLQRIHIIYLYYIVLLLSFSFSPILFTTLLFLQFLYSKTTTTTTKINTITVPSYGYGCIIRQYLGLG